MLIAAVLAIFVAVILIRTLRFRPKVRPALSTEPVEFDRDRAVSNLAELIRCKTISYSDPSLEDDAEFEKLIGKLPALYPNVFEKCEFSRLPDRALLLRWPGKSADEPAVLMAHYDVVPVNEEKWDKPAFEAVIEDGVMWGRGTLDTKGTFNGALFAADTLISQNFVPEHDVYFAFSGGEEVNGKGAHNIVELFQEKEIVPGIVVDEGGAVVENVFPGVKVPCGLVGIAEKGMMNARFRTISAGGHASAPMPNMPIDDLAKACMEVVGHPFKMHLTKPVAEMFDTLGRYSNFLYRMIFANLWCFGWVLDLLSRRSGGDMNALLRTTVAFTRMKGSSARNVIPPEASMVANMRLNLADTVESALEYLRKTVGNDRVEITDLESFEPSRISRTDCESWDRVAAAVGETWSGCIVSPYLMIQCSDSRSWGVLSDKVYRFCAMDLTDEERATVHGNNERVRLSAICKTVEFYIRLIKKC